MKNRSISLLKYGAALCLVAPLAFAANRTISDSSLAEPLYLSLCGLTLILFGLIKNKKIDID